jgi:hypothetical protein
VSRHDAANRAVQRACRAAPPRTRYAGRRGWRCDAGGGAGPGEQEVGARGHALQARVRAAATSAARGPRRRVVRGAPHERSATLTPPAVVASAPC